MNITYEPIEEMKEKVFVDGEEIGQLKLARACGPFGNEIWKWCWRVKGEPMFDWLEGVDGKGESSKRMATDKLIEACLLARIINEVVD